MLKYSVTIIALAAFMCPGPASAERVRAEQYRYDLEIAKDSNTTDPFVICSECMAGKLSAEPNTPLVMKYSGQNIITPPPLPIEQDNSVKTDENIEKKAPQHGVRLIESVYFPFDQSQVPAQEKKRLDALSGGKVKLKGYTCTIGDESYNLSLSKRRAESVAKYLRQRGVKILELKGMGETADHKNKNYNRRVDIFEE